MEFVGMINATCHVCWILYEGHFYIHFIAKYNSICLWYLLTMSTISFDEFDQSIKLVSDLVYETELVHYKDNVYLKKESNQITGSFKWRGVLFSIMTAFEKLLTQNIDESQPFYMVTQSTGNHGIAVIHAVNLMRLYYTYKYPYEKDTWKSVYPCVFGNAYIKPSKFEKMQNEIAQFHDGHKCILDCSAKNYAEALSKREEFLETNQGMYMSHGGKDIMTGYGSLAREIQSQIPSEKSVTVITAIGAGGPIGLGTYFEYCPKYSLVVSQTREFNAFVRGLESKQIEYNPTDVQPELSDGIAVDKPEEYALKEAIRLGIQGVTVDSADVGMIHDETGLGGSSCIAFAALDKIDIDTDIVVILDCEGNWNE